MRSATTRHAAPAGVDDPGAADGATRRHRPLQEIPASRTPRRAALALALAATLSLGTAGAALAGPAAKPAPAAAKVAAQVTLRVTPVTTTTATTDYRAVVTVKAPQTAVTGTYQLLDGSTVVGSGTLVSGTASVPLTLAPGSHRLSAVYSGAAKVNGAGTKQVTVPVPVSGPQQEVVLEG